MGDGREGSITVVVQHSTSEEGDPGKEHHFQRDATIKDLRTRILEEDGIDDQRQTIYYNGFAIPSDWDQMKIVEAVKLIGKWTISAFTDSNGDEIILDEADTDDDYDDRSLDLHLVFYVEFPTAGQKEGHVTSFVLRPKIVAKRRHFEAFPIIEGCMDKFDPDFWTQTKMFALVQGTNMKNLEYQMDLYRFEEGATDIHLDKEEGKQFWRVLKTGEDGKKMEVEPVKKKRKTAKFQDVFVV